MKITFFFFFSTSVWWRMMAHTVILSLQYRWTCLRGFIGVRSGSGWRAWWNVTVRLSEVPLVHYRARTSDLSAHWNKYFPFSLFFLNWNQRWVVSPLPSIAFTHSYQSLPDLEGDHCLCLGKEQELHQGGWVSKPRGGPEEGVTGWQQIQRKPS